MSRAVIKAFDGLTVIGGRAGHPDPQPDQLPEGAWYVMFIVQQTDQGWFALEFLAWAINSGASEPLRQRHCRRPARHG